jgi:predicted TIM-barrel fold metal-dependent hydrolase
VRPEIPWVDRPPSDIIRERVFVTLQPVDAPDDPAVIGRVLDHIGTTGMLLFSTDYPHWQFEGDGALPRSLPDAALPGILSGNALRAYPRLAAETASAARAAELEARP